jgi:hypothetical protein
MPGRHLLRIRSGMPFSAIVLLLKGADITAAPILGVERLEIPAGIIRSRLADWKTTGKSVGPPGDR